MTGGHAREPAPRHGALLVRAGRYRLLAELFAAEPDRELLRVAATVPELARHADLDASRRYTHVFVLNAYPFASVYLEPEASIGGERAGFTRGVLEALGLQVDETVSADHAAVSFAALGALLEREAGAREAVRAERARHAQRTVLAEHLLPWAPLFLAAIGRVDHDLYGAAAALAGRLLGEHAAALFPADGRAAAAGRGATAGGGIAAGGRDEVADGPGAGGDGALHGAAPAGEAGERDRRELLDRLASPARSGLFLSREDITAVAAASGLAVRFGGRPFMLESVVQAAVQRGAGDALEASLTRLAAGQRRELEAWSARLPALAPLWRDTLTRLDATVAEWRSEGAVGAAGA